MTRAFLLVFPIKEHFQSYEMMNSFEDMQFTLKVKKMQLLLGIEEERQHILNETKEVMKKSRQQQASLRDCITLLEKKLMQTDVEILRVSVYTLCLMQKAVCTYKFSLHSPIKLLLAVNVVLTDWTSWKEYLDANPEEGEDKRKKGERIGPENDNGSTGSKKRPLQEDMRGVEPRGNHGRTPF
ncbi:hypothetical protein NDU88_009266 [Pleurodeles waltl]|uniref:Uncharacterized protein n=1 Tax=Pleurodeles waltl TaxID=8319 RepID=A0AAV7PUK6_PLEWA|nr:hypothetical protein NDU88_009266 [Pleurodeles waltl]